MTEPLVPYIGRKHELALAEHLLGQDGSVRVLCVDGKGGIGKTRFLQELVQRYPSSNRIVSTKILDFDALQLRVPGSLKLEVARRLGNERFQHYFRALHDWHQLQRARVSYERLEQQARALSAVFDQDYRALAGERRILVLMDTVESIQDTEIWNEIVDLIHSTANTLFILAGRTASAAARRLRSVFGGDIIHSIRLQPFAARNATAYIRAKERHLHLRLDSEFRQKVVLVAAGSPILLDLVSEWVAREVPMPWLTEQPVQALEHIPASQREELEAALVRPIHDRPTLLNQVILHMAYVYPMDGDMLRMLFNVSGRAAQTLISDLRRLAFVKVLPDGSFSLHDEMRRMVNKHIWEDIDRDQARRRQVSAKVAGYFTAHADRLQSAMTETSAQPSLATEEFVEQSQLLREYWILREQQLFHQLQTDLAAGLALFQALFDEATRTYQLSIRMDLINRTLAFEQRLSEEQRYEVYIRRARAWIDTGRQDDIRQARELLEDLRRIYADDSEHELDILTRLANCAIKLGQIPISADLLQRAQEIAQQKLHTWVDTVQNTLGYTYRLLGRLDLARDAYLQAMAHADDPVTTASIYNNLGFIECLQGEYESGLHFCQQALDIRSRLRLRRELGISYSTVADIYRHWGRYELAVEASNQAIAIFEPLQDPEWLARVYSRRGAARRLQAQAADERASAIADLQKSLELDYPPEKPYAAHVMGCVYWDSGNLEEALRWFAESETYLSQRFDIWNHMNNLIASAEIYFRKWQDTDDKSQKTAYRAKIQQYWRAIAREAARGYTLSHQIGRINRLLGDLAYAEGRHKRALEYYAEAYALLSGRYAGYGRRTLSDELDELGRRIDNLPPEQAIKWCDYLAEVWSDPAREIRKRTALLTLCQTHRTKARLNLPQAV